MLVLRAPPILTPRSSLRNGDLWQRQHIALYVNEFTRDLGEEGYAAAEALLSAAHEAGLAPATPPLR